VHTTTMFIAIINSSVNLALPVENCKILLEQYLTDHMPLLPAAASTFRLSRRC